MPLKETTTAGFATDLENRFGPGNGYDSVSYTVLTGGAKPESKYALNTPTKIIISGSYVFREVEDIKRQKGFITADIEYTNYKWMKYAPENPDNTDPSVYDPYNEAIDAFNQSLAQDPKQGPCLFNLGNAYFN